MTKSRSIQKSTKTDCGGWRDMLPIFLHEVEKSYFKCLMEQTHGDMWLIICTDSSLICNVHLFLQTVVANFFIVLHTDYFLSFCIGCTLYIINKSLFTATAKYKTLFRTFILQPLENEHTISYTTIKVRYIICTWWYIICLSVLFIYIRAVKLTR